MWLTSDLLLDVQQPWVETCECAGQSLSCRAIVWTAFDESRSSFCETKMSQLGQTFFVGLVCCHCHPHLPVERVLCRSLWSFGLWTDSGMKVCARTESFWGSDFAHKCNKQSFHIKKQWFQKCSFTGEWNTPSSVNESFEPLASNMLVAEALKKVCVAA